MNNAILKMRRIDLLFQCPAYVGRSHSVCRCCRSLVL
jgi:hypothetical protein